MQENHKAANTTKETKFRVGQTVWCLLYGKGKVSEIDSSDPTYSVHVEFEDSGELLWYTHDGKYTTLGNRTLFFSEPQVIAETEPVFEPKLVGKRVLVTYPATNSVLTCDFVKSENELTVVLQNSCSFSKATHNFYVVDSEPAEFN